MEGDDRSAPLLGADTGRGARPSSLRRRDSARSLRSSFLSRLPDKMRAGAGLDPECPSDVDLARAKGLSQGEREYYEKQLATLRTFEEAEALCMPGEFDSDLQVLEDKEQQSEFAMKISNYANIVLLAFKWIAVSHAEDHEISLCDPNSEDDWRRRKIGSLRRKAIHALRKRGRRRVDFRFPAAISIEDVRDAEEERAVAAFRNRLAAHGLLPGKHDGYHMMLRFLKARKFDSEKAMQPRGTLLPQLPSWMSTGFKNFSKTAREIVHHMQKIDSDYYPETLHQMYVVNAGSGFKLIWNSVKGFLDPKTSSKIHVIVSNYQSRLLEVIDSSELPEFLGGSCTCSDKGGCLGSNKGPWNDPVILKLIHSMGSGSLREIKQISDEEERNGSSLRAEKLKGMISDASNAESESDVDDFGLSVVHKSTDYSLLTPVREEVKGSDSSTFCSCESCDGTQGVEQSSERVPQQMTHQKHSTTIRWLHNLGNIALSLHGTPAGSALENLVRGVATALINISSSFHLFVCRQERIQENTHPSTVAKQPLPLTVREDDVSACLQRLEKLESLCNHLESKPPDMPKEKERLLSQCFDRIKSIEADLEMTKRVSCFAQ